MPSADARVSMVAMVGLKYLPVSSFDRFALLIPVRRSRSLRLRPCRYVLVLVRGNQISQDVHVLLGSPVPLLSQQFVEQLECLIQVKLVSDMDERESFHES
jgi:hypothetical protein